MDDAPRPHLRSIATTGWRASVRGAVRLALIGCAAIAIVGLVIERHRPCGSDYHPGAMHEWGTPRRIVDDLGWAPLALVALVVVAQAIAHRGRVVASTLLGPIAALVALGVLMTLVRIHGRGHTLETTFVADAALLGVAALGLLQLAVEPWLALAELRSRSRTSP